MVTVQGEVEKKYVADDRFELPPLTELMAEAKGRRDGGIAPVVEGEPARQRLEATYFDTADLRLASAGLTLRRRTGGDDAGWHLKIPAGSDTPSGGRLPLGAGPRAPRGAPPATGAGPTDAADAAAADGVGTQLGGRAAAGGRERDRADGAPTAGRDGARRGGGGRWPGQGPPTAAHGRSGRRGDGRDVVA